MASTNNSNQDGATEYLARLVRENKSSHKPDYDWFTSMKPEHQITYLMEMADELMDHKSKIHVVISMAVNLLMPKEGSDSVDYQAWKLNELADDLLSDCSQDYRLKALMSAMGENLLKAKEQ